MDQRQLRVIPLMVKLTPSLYDSSIQRVIRLIGYRYNYLMGVNSVYRPIKHSPPSGFGVRERGDGVQSSIRVASRVQTGSRVRHTESTLFSFFKVLGVSFRGNVHFVVTDLQYMLSKVCCNAPKMVRKTLN